MLAPERLPNNKLKIERTRQVIQDLLSKVLNDDFFGSATIEIVVQGGSIQEIKERIERKHR